MGVFTTRRMLLAAAFLAWSGRAPGSEPKAAPAGVVATFSILADLVRQVGGEAVAVKSLVPADGDAHTFEPRPSNLEGLRSARLLVVNGLGLEGWLDRLVRASGYRGAVVVASRGVVPRRLPSGEPDPHAWQDPRNALIYVRNIADGLAAAVPGQAEAIRARAAAYADEVRAADAFVERTLAPIPPSKRRVITSHDAFGYYGARYGVEFRAAQGIDTETEPSARDIARLADQIRREGIRAVFVENMTDPRLARALAREAGASVGPTVYSDSLSTPDGPAPTYVAMLRYDAPLFAAAMAAN